MMDYPLFVAPDELAAKPHREWTLQEAKAYFAWFLDVMPSRIEAFLRFAGAPEAPDYDRSLLLFAGEQMAPHLRAEFDPSAQTLTNRGYAMAADLGLLTAEVLLREAGGALRWELLRKPKSDLSYNLPVLSGFVAKMILDPVGGSIAEARALLRGRRAPDIWAGVYDHWIAKVQR